MDYNLKENERLDDLEYKNLRLIQNPNGYCYNSDSVILANQVKGGAKKRVCDLCAGSGVVGILVQAKNNCLVDIVELQTELCDMAKRSIAGNGQSEKINTHNCDLANYALQYGKNQYDIITCNPPYFSIASGKKSDNESIAIARQEIKTNLAEILSAVSKLIKYGGKLFIVYKADRLAELIVKANAYQLELKKLICLFPKKYKKADTFIAEFKMGGKCGLEINSFVMFNDDNTLTEKAKEFYGY